MKIRKRHLGKCGKKRKKKAVVFDPRILLDLDRKPSLWERVVKFVKWK